MQIFQQKEKQINPNSHFCDVTDTYLRQGKVIHVLS
jgi:hypothetical protein